jgi:hypothetical protein
MDSYDQEMVMHFGLRGLIAKEIMLKMLEKDLSAEDTVCLEEFSVKKADSFIAELSKERSK